MNLTRREFIKLMAAAGLGTWLEWETNGVWALEPEIDNPLSHYPNRDWEKIYRDAYRYDSTFSWVCSPNDTHACRVLAYVRNGVVVRMGSEYNYQTYRDLYGNTATPNWNPRQCAKGYTFHRILYGPSRLKYPIVRQGWRRWAKDGFPDLTPELKKHYKFDDRGHDVFERISWEEAYELIAKALIAICRRYSGPEGRRRLEAEGYPPEMLDAMEGAGTRTVKMRGGMGLLGVFGKYGMYRLANTLALLDVHIRGVDQQKARGGRSWSNYTWHGDQAPGHPWVHGLQNAECDFNDLRFSKLIIQDGKNLVENKMVDSHWFIECMERGAKLVTISPEYSPPATKSDYWIPIRPATDAALFLGVARLIIDREWYDHDFIVKYTDWPLLVRLDTLKRLRADEIFPGYQPQLDPQGPSYRIQGLKPEQYSKIGDFVVWDEEQQKPVAVTRDDVGDPFMKKVKRPALDGQFTVTTVTGEKITVMPLFALYRIHLKDYDLDTVAEITNAPKDLIEQLAKDIATIKPAALHQGEGINHWFHATEMNRAAYLPFMLTGNIGRHGAGVFAWAGNYKAALFQGSAQTGPGFKGWVAEDPFQPNLDPKAHGRQIKTKAFFKDEEPAYWNHGDRPLIVDTPQGRKVFTGQTHMPTPTKVIMFNNVNLINNAKHCYDMIKNVNPNVEFILSMDIQMTASIEYADMALPANSWLEFEGLEVTASCSNPFLQIWKGGIPPVFDSRDDLVILAQIAEALGKETKDKRFSDYWHFALNNQREVYIQRLLDSCTTTTGYRLEDIMAGRYGPPGGALMLFRTYPRVAFWEQIHDQIPFYTDTGRLNAYSDLNEAIEYGENFIVHREGPEATPYLPNVIVSTNPYIRPKDYGLSLDEEHWDKRSVRNIKLSWAETKQTQNFLWKKGFQFYCLTPKSRHRVHSLWSNVDWHEIWDSNFGDPYRMDKRLPSVGEQQLHINPQAAKDMGLNDGDYVYVDANPADRPYRGARSDDPFYKVARLMLRVKYNPAYPYHIVMLKHGTYIATEKTVASHETRPDGLAVSQNGAYHANFRYGSQQSVTRNWHMPMHQTDTLFHKAKVFMGFIFGGEADNHAVNTVPKETLVRIVKAEDGGLNGKGVWAPATTDYTPANENDVMKKYLSGEFYQEKGEGDAFWF